MTTGIPRPDPGTAGGRSPEPEHLVECLSDEKCRDVLAATSTSPKSVKEIASHCDISTSTAYRKVRHLVEADLLLEETTLPHNGTLVSKYASDVDAVTITVTGDGELVVLDAAPEVQPARARGSDD